VRCTRDWIGLHDHRKYTRRNVVLQLLAEPALPKREILRNQSPGPAVLDLGLARVTLGGKVLGPPGADIFPTALR
jgi:hypothetical protein